MIRGLVVKEGRRTEEVELVLKKMGVRLAKEEQKREILRKKSMLRGRKERVSEDLTWRERRMKWKLEEIASMGMAGGDERGYEGKGNGGIGDGDKIRPGGDGWR